MYFANCELNLWIFSLCRLEVLTALYRAPDFSLTAVVTHTPLSMLEEQWANLCVLILALLQTCFHEDALSLIYFWGTLRATSKVAIWNAQTLPTLSTARRDKSRCKPSMNRWKIRQTVYFLEFSNEPGRH